MSHKCHAIGCEREVPPRLLMCYLHWKKVPRLLQLQVWKEYRPGQYKGGYISPAYLAAARAAIDAVGDTRKEGQG